VIGRLWGCREGASRGQVDEPNKNHKQQARNKRHVQRLDAQNMVVGEFLLAIRIGSSHTASQSTRLCHPPQAAAVTCSAARQPTTRKYCGGGGFADHFGEVKVYQKVLMLTHSPLVVMVCAARYEKNEKKMPRWFSKQTQSS
jgi:hypothetical protein